MLELGKYSVVIAVIAFVASACSSATAPSPVPSAIPSGNSPVAVGWTNRALAEASITAQPTGPVHVEVVSAQQEPARSVEHAHLGGFVFALSGAHRLTTQSEPARDLSPGDAAFIPQGAVHTHATAGAIPSRWYYVTIRNSGSDPPDRSVVYVSPDLPTFAANKFSERLSLAMLERGGRSPAHRHAGVEVLFVLEGTVELRLAGQPPRTVTEGKGAYAGPNVVMQLANMGDGIARFLTFTVTPDGVEDTTLVDTAP